MPDAKTIWLFREHLVQAGAVDNLFARFDKHLAKAGYLAMGGQIVDATIVAAPKQRNTNAEKAAIKAGKVPDDWQDKPAKLRQKDRDARWTVKFSKAKPKEDGAKQVDIAIPVFGYKNHAAIDRRHGLIRGWTVTGASAYDGAQLRNVLDRKNTGSTVWADTAYARATKRGSTGTATYGHSPQEAERPADERGSHGGGGRQSHAKIEIDHADFDAGSKLLSEAIGSENRDFLLGTIDSLAMAARSGRTIDQGKMNYALAFVKGLHPADQLEATLGVQMAAIHLATMKAAENLAGAPSIEMMDMQERL